MEPSGSCDRADDQTWADRFRVHLRVVRNMSPRTVDAYLRDLLQFQAVLTEADGAWVGWQALDSMAIRRWLMLMHRRGISARSTARKISALRAFYRFLHHEGVVSDSPLERIHAALSPKRLPRFFSEEEISKLLLAPARSEAQAAMLPRDPIPERTRKALVLRDNAILETLDLSASARQARLEELLGDLHLTHVAGQRAYTLSGGERRKLEIARSLVRRPTILMLDEPFSGVDPLAVHDIQQIIRGLRDKGLGIVITDHNVRETLAVVDRAYLICDGQVLREGTSEFLINDPAARELYLGRSFRM